MTSAADLIDARPEELGVSSARVERLGDVGKRYVDRGQIPGALSMMARGGEVIYCDTYGSMDLEAGKAVQPDTIFRIYSMTKPIASVALMTLYEEGYFHLDDPVSEFIPSFKGLEVFDRGTVDDYRTRPPQREMTVRDVLAHTSGLTTGLPSVEPSVVRELYRREGVPGVTTQGTLAGTIESLSRVPLATDPGTQWIYSMSTDVVSYLCEVFSGQSFDRVLQERIFDPLQMTDTAFYVDPANLDRFAANYRTAPGGGLELIDPPATSDFATPGTYFSGVGGLTSTALDYMRFAQMLAQGGALDGEQILGSRTLDLMVSNHLPGPDLHAVSSPRLRPYQVNPGTAFGLGFAILLDPAASNILGTPGEYYWSGAAGTQFFISPLDDLVVVFMTQLMFSDLPLARDIRVAAYQALID